MGYKHGGFAFRGRCYSDPDVGRKWQTGDAISRMVLGPLVPYLARVKWMSRDFADPEPITSVETLVAHADEWGHDIVSMWSGAQEDPDWLVFIALDTVGPRFAIGIPQGEVTAPMREDVFGWVRAWSEALPAAGVRFATGAFLPIGRHYPRPVPPRYSHSWEMGVLDLYVGRTWHRMSDDRTPVLERLENAPLPAGARRIVEGDVVRIAMAADLGDAGSVVAARVAHEAWLTPLVPAQIEVGWNELGDWAIAVSRPKVIEPLTLYDEWTGIGYKALVVFPEDGSVEEHLWAQAAAIARAGKLPDGTPVKSVRLVFPRREDALAMHARALADGFEMTLYGGKHHFWQVHPNREKPAS